MGQPPPPTPSVPRAAELCLCRSFQRDAQPPPFSVLIKLALLYVQLCSREQSPSTGPRSYPVLLHCCPGTERKSCRLGFPQSLCRRGAGGRWAPPGGLGFACRSLSCVRSCWTIYNLSVSTGNAERKSRVIGRKTEVPLANSPLICKHIRKKPEVWASFMNPASHGDCHLKTETGGSRFHSCLLG